MKTKFCIFAMTGTLRLLPPRASAATKTWDGSTSASWNTAANWTNNAVPVDGDDLLFPAGALNKANNNNLPVVNLRSITFTDGGYTVSGNALLLSGTNGITSSQASGSNAITQSISLATNQTFTVTTAGASLGLGGNVTLNAFELTTSGNGFANFSGSISGTGGFTKLGSGTNRFSGGGANSFTGGTAVGAGTLELNKTAGLNAVPGPLTIGDGSGPVDSAVVRLLAANQVAGSSAVTIEDDGLLDLNANLETIGSLTVTGGDVTTGVGTLTLGGDVTANASTNTATISGNDVVLTQLTALQQPVLNLALFGTRAVLSWATNFPGFTLEANPNLDPTVWTVVTNAPVITGTNNVVTNLVSALENYYRLRAP